MSARPANPDAHADIGCVLRMARGDESGLAELYDRHATAMLAIGRQMLGDEAAAEDAVHDVLLEAWRKAESFDAARGTVRAWLLVRMRSRCLDRVRALRVRRELTEHDAPTPAPAPRPDEGLAAGDSDRVQQAIATLPDAQRHVLELIYFQGLSSTQAAEALGCPTGTVKSRVRLALGALRAALAPEESP